MARERGDEKQRRKREKRKRKNERGENSVNECELFYTRFLLFLFLFFKTNNKCCMAYHMSSKLLF